MNYSTPTYSTIKPITSVLKTGGTPSFIQRIGGYFTNWKVIAMIIIGLLLVLFAYYTYKQYADTKTSFHSRETFRT